MPDSDYTSIHVSEAGLRFLNLPYGLIGIPMALFSVWSKHNDAQGTSAFRIPFKKIEAGPPTDPAKLPPWRKAIGYVGLFSIFNAIWDILQLSINTTHLSSLDLNQRTVSAFGCLIFWYLLDSLSDLVFATVNVYRSLRNHSGNYIQPTTVIEDGTPAESKDEKYMRRALAWSQISTYYGPYGILGLLGQGYQTSDSFSSGVKLAGPIVASAILAVLFWLFLVARACGCGKSLVTGHPKLRLAWHFWYPFLCSACTHIVIGLFVNNITGVPPTLGQDFRHLVKSASGVSSYVTNPGLRTTFLAIYIVIKVVSRASASLRSLGMAEQAAQLDIQDDEDKDLESPDMLSNSSVSVPLVSYHTAALCPGPVETRVVT